MEEDKFTQPKQLKLLETVEISSSQFLSPELRGQLLPVPVTIIRP
jgi:hypothetical protein